MSIIQDEISDKKIKFISICNNTINRQIESKNAIQGSASKVLSFTAVFITVLLAIYKNSLNINETTTINFPPCLIIIPTLLGIISIFFLIECIRSSSFLIGISEDDFSELSERPLDDIVTYEMNVAESAVIENTKELRNIKIKFAFGLYLMFASLIFSLALLIIIIYK